MPDLVARDIWFWREAMFPKKVFFAAASCFSLATAAAHEAIQYSGVLNVDTLACIHLDDAENLINFTPTDQFPTSRSFLAAVQETDRCVWWHKGDRVIISVQAYYATKRVVAAQRPPDAHYFYVDKCGVEGAPCP